MYVKLGTFTVIKCISSLHLIPSCLERNCVDNVIVYIQNFMLGFRVIFFLFCGSKIIF